MDSRLRIARNVVIVLVIAAAVEFLPGGGRAAHTIEAILLVGFALALAYMGARFYREHRVAIYGLGERQRGLLYGSLAVGFVTLAARVRMWETGFGELAWFVLMGLVAYTLLAVYRFSRTY